MVPGVTNLVKNFPGCGSLRVWVPRCGSLRQHSEVDPNSLSVSTILSNRTTPPNQLSKVQEVQENKSVHDHSGKCLWPSVAQRRPILPEHHERIEGCGSL